MKFAQKNFQGDFFSFISDKNVIFYEVCKIAESLAVLRPTLFWANTNYITFFFQKWDNFVSSQLFFSIWQS